MGSASIRCITQSITFIYRWIIQFLPGRKETNNDKHIFLNNYQFMTFLGILGIEQSHPLIQIWSLLTPKKQDGGGHKVKLKALETALHKPVGDITLTLGPVVSYRAEA